MWSLVDGKHIMYVPHHDGLHMDRVGDGLDEEIDRMDSDFPMQMKEVTVAVLDSITREVKRLSESVRKVNDRQTCFESVLKLGTGPTEDQRIDSIPGGQPSEAGYMSRGGHHDSKRHSLQAVELSHTPPRAKYIHLSHTPPTALTTLISRTSPVLDKPPEPRYHSYTHSPQPHHRTPHQHCRHPRTLTLSQRTHATQITVHTSQSPQQPHSQHRVRRQPHKQTKDYHSTTNTTQTQRPSSKSEINLIILQVNINGLRNQLEELKLLICDTDADIITIQETKLTPTAKTPKIHNFTTVRTDRLHKAGGELITLIRDNITFTTTDIPSTINTHNTKLQMVKVHINNTKHITIANIYIPPGDTTSTHYKTADTDIQHCIQYIMNIPHSVLTGDVNAHSTL